MNEITLNVENLLFEDVVLVTKILELSGFTFGRLNEKDERIYCNSKNQVVHFTVDSKKNEVTKIYIK